MIPRASRAFLLLLLAAFAVSVSYSEDVTPSTPSPFYCPESCTCTDHTVGNRELKHARCESIEALHDKQWPVYSLDLSGLSLTKVPAAVEKLRNLTRLNLSHNHITEVSRISNRIQELNLSHNRIGSGKLAKLPVYLKKLNLGHNHITVVPAELKKLDHLRELELAGNPINCSCETIQVRNWLQSRRVWTHDVIKCSLPQNYKARPWLQVKQSDICHMTPAEIEEEKNIWEDSNDLMMGDQAAPGSGEGHDDVDNHEDHHEEAHDALEDDYMRVDEDPRAMPYGDADAELEEGSGQPMVHDPLFPKTHMDDIEGSGNDAIVSRINQDNVDSTTTNPAGDDEDEGSGIIPIPIPKFDRGLLGGEKPPKNENEFHEEKLEHDEKDEPIEEPMGTPPGTSKGLGIFQEHDSDSPSKDVNPLSDATLTAAEPKIIGGSDAGGALHNIEEPEKADSTKLYTVLAILLAIMIVLILIVVVKQRSARNNNNRRGQADVESAKLTELQDMNQRMVGKPIEKRENGENAPLIGQREKSDFAKPINGQRDCDKIGFNPYEKPASPEHERHVPLKSSDPNEGNIEKNQQSPLGTFKNNGRVESKDSINENNNNDEDLNNNNNNNQFQPISNGYPQENGVTHSPPMDSPPGVHKAKKDEDWEKYTPRSPDMKRYSPVYSPETGRVKIRLSETPKPKTPLLVTRSRSNAGQMILTPNLSQRPQRPENAEATLS